MAHFLDLNQLLCAQTVCFARYFAQLHLLFGRRDFMQVSRRNMNGLRWLTLQRKTADIRQLSEPYLQKALHRKKNLHSIHSSYSRPNDSSRYGEGKKTGLTLTIYPPGPCRLLSMDWHLSWHKSAALPAGRFGAWSMVPQKNATHPGSQKVPRRPPYAIPLAAICNPVGHHMQSRRPPYGIPSAAICNPAGRHMQSRRPPYGIPSAAKC